MFTNESLVFRFCFWCGVLADFGFIVLYSIIVFPFSIISFFRNAFDSALSMSDNLYR